MSQNQEIKIGELSRLIPIKGHQIEVARNQRGYILIIDGVDRSCGHSSVRSAEEQACYIFGRELGFRALP